LCQTCGHPKEQSDKNACNSCLEIIRNINNARKLQWKEQGLCCKCGGNLDERTHDSLTTGWYLCAKCLDHAKDKRFTDKQVVINYYGGQCNCCEETCIDLLTLDHIDNNGNEHRKQLYGDSRKSIPYDWYIKNSFPKDFQLLCFNCNSGKYLNGGLCPHKTIECYKNKSYQSKLETITHYGGKCTCCGETKLHFLTIDHKNNDGADHRRKLGDPHFGGIKIYRWLKKNSYPKEFQILCFNCNLGKYYNNGICPHTLLA
jgi:predicted DNA-binding transcriptional regulator AlpA